MTLKECYAALGGDYDDVSGRLRSERLVRKFVLKYLDDPSYGDLCDAMAGGDSEAAFRAAHTIKGVCQNMAFTALLSSSSRLSDALRHGYTPEADGLFEELRGDHERVISAIEAYSRSSGGEV